MIGVLLNLGQRQGTSKVGPIQTASMKSEAIPNKNNAIDNYNREGKN
jgi:hypothetical protein